MYQNPMRPAWVEIDLDALDFNVKAIKKKIGNKKKIIGIVKADAYGHGAFAVSDILKRNGVNSFAVATLPEAVALRQYFEESDKSTDASTDADTSTKEDILVLGLIPDMYADEVVKYDLAPVVCDINNARAFSDAALAAGKTVSVLIKIDTGMGRIGYVVPSTSSASYESELAAIIEQIRIIAALPSLQIIGIISHMSAADEKDKTYSHMQAEKYIAFCNALKASDILSPFPFMTFSNSAGIMELPDTYFDAVRPGIILYGCYPSNEVDKALIDLKPVMSVKASIVHLKEVPAGFSVGYGRGYISKAPAVIATIGLGYADGYPRRFSAIAQDAAAEYRNSGDYSDTKTCNCTKKPFPCVIVNGSYAPLAGKICMDQCMIDVTDIPDIKVGDEVIVMGRSGALSVTADDIASAVGTINYEILCGFALRLPRVYKAAGELIR